MSIQAINVRNQFKGKVREIIRGDVVSEVDVETPWGVVTSVITTRSVDDLGLVVIDYLQLMTSAGGKGYSGENRQQAVSDISRMLKIMAKELQVPVLCLSQLSREEVEKTL